MRVKPSERLKGLSEYYFSRKLAELQKLQEAGRDIINLGIGNPDLPPGKEVIKVLQHESAQHENHGYQSYKGVPMLRKAMKEWYARFFDVSLDSGSEILPLMGSKEGIMHISMAFLNPGDEVLVANPAYPVYAAAASLAGASVRYYPLTEKNRFLPDLSALEKENLTRVKIMWVNYPNMPTGKSAESTLFKRLVSFGKRHNILIVNDNPYGLILTRKPESILKADPGLEIAMELNSLSKSHNMAGWRIGMLAGNKAYINAVLNVKSNMDSGMFKPLQLAAAAALRNSEKQIEKLNTVYRVRRQRVFDILECMGCTFQNESAGLFVWARIPRSFDDSEQFSDWLLDKTGIFITPGFVFGSEGMQYVRLSLSNSDDVLSEAYARVKELKEKKLSGRKLKKAI